MLSELKGQIVSRIEYLDEAHSYVEYTRQRSETCCKEAKVVLNHSAIVAGDYDCQLSGVYGDAASSVAEKESDLILLMRQLIAMLESGGPFYLSTELLNVIRDAAGSGNVHNINNYNVSGQAGQTVSSGGVGQSKTLKGSKLEKIATSGDAKKGKATLVKASKETKYKKEQVESAATVSDENDAWKELLRKLFEKHAYEAAKLENELKLEEIGSIQDMLNECEKKKQSMMFDAKEDLRQKLRSIGSEKERERMMSGYAMNLQKVNDAFDKQKQMQLEGLREKLIESRRNRKKELYRKQCSEAEERGISLESVPDVNLPSHDEMMQDILRLQRNQERSLAEIQIQGESAEDDVQVICLVQFLYETFIILIFLFRLLNNETATLIKLCC